MVYRKYVKATIVDGPSKMDLMTALAYAYDQKRGPFSVTFHLEPENQEKSADVSIWRKVSGTKGTPMKAKIAGISHEDGTGESFNIHGYMDVYDCSKPDFSTEFKGYYSTKNHNGTIDFYIQTADDKKS